MRVAAAVLSLAVPLLADAAAIPSVRVQSLAPGTYEAKLDDGSVFAYGLETEDPAKPGIDFTILKADPARTVSLVIPRRHYWRHVDVVSGEDWVDCVREGQTYRISRAFKPNEKVSFRYEFDPDDVPGVAPRPDSEKVWEADFGDGKSVRFALDDQCSVNLERFRPDHPPYDAATATVSRVIRCEKDETRVFGVSADWWFTAFLNGREVYTTWPNGNSSDLKSPYAHVLRLALGKGENRLTFKTSPGSDSWDFMCREFPSYDRWPDDEPNRRRTFETMFPVETALKYGPWVTAVSCDGARVGVELTADGLAGIRYAGPDGRRQVKWTAVCGQKDYRRVHLFELGGLAADAEYAYEIVLLDEGTRKETSLAKGTFRTFPASGASCAFNLLGDTQFDDAGRKAVIDRLLKLGLDKGGFIVSVGDVGNSFDDFSAVYHESFLEHFRRRGVTLPTVLVRGNHEFHGRRTADFPRHFGRPYYTFTCGDTFYFVIDTGEWANLPRMEMPAYCAEQAAWLAQEIETSACRRAKRRIMLAHTVPFEGEGAARAKVVADICAEAFYGETPKCRLDLWLCGDIHAAYRYDPVSRRIAGRARVAGAPRPTENDFRRIRFPVYVNDGPNAGRAKQTMTRVEFPSDAILITVFDQWGQMMDRTRLTPGKPVEIIESHWDYRNYKD